MIAFFVHVFGRAENENDKHTPIITKFGTVDTIGPLIQSEDYKFVIIFACHFTRFAITVPAYRVDAEAVARALVNAVIIRYGCPRVLLSDNGTEYKNALLNPISKMTQIERIFISAYHPQSNGIVERFNGTIKQILNILTVRTQKQTRWAEILPLAVYAYNTSVVDSTQMTPFEAVFGRTAQPPFWPAPVETEIAGDDPQQEYAARLRFDLDLAWQIIQTLADEKKLELLDENARKAVVHVYQPGSQVYLKNSKGGRIGHRPDGGQWLGPYLILRRLGPVTYELRLVDKDGKLSGKTTRVHVSRLKSIPDSTPRPPTPQDTHRVTGSGRVSEDCQEVVRGRRSVGRRVCLSERRASDRRVRTGRSASERLFWRARLDCVLEQ
ncbi:MAG: hypothetical protein P4L81_08235 [Candidatus Pacebacteria bacterium]|nr:hypothetical protein [Candidatus Paceibacterota bacterium]